MEHLFPCFEKATSPDTAICFFVNVFQDLNLYPDTCPSRNLPCSALPTSEKKSTILEVY
jgi:hypothetical protein